jgi:MerR family mercuric resistance operon transcriptional regulator
MHKLTIKPVATTGSRQFMNNINYSRGQLVTPTGVKSETIRYYEGRGLLPTAVKSTGGHRIYSEVHVKRLIFIRRSRELGFTLGEIEELIDLSTDTEKSCEHVRDASVVHLADIKTKIKDLKKMQATLSKMIKQCDTNTSPSCPIIEALCS